MSAFTCGLDVHKNWSDVTVRRDSDGEIVGGRRRLPNGDLFGFLSEYHGIERIAMEASTSIVPVYGAPREEGYQVVVSHSKKAMLIAESMIKTDRVDSEALSELARLNALPLSSIPEPSVAKLREKVKRRAFLVRMKSTLRVRPEASSSTRESRSPKSMACSRRKESRGSTRARCSRELPSNPVLERIEAIGAER